jgi:hypothetical protein
VSQITECVTDALSFVLSIPIRIRPSEFFAERREAYSALERSRLRIHDMIREGQSDPCMELGGVAFFPNALKSSNVHLNMATPFPSHQRTSNLRRMPLQSLQMCFKHSKHFCIGPPAANSYSRGLERLAVFCIGNSECNLRTD